MDWVTILRIVSNVAIVVLAFVSVALSRRLVSEEKKLSLKERLIFIQTYAGLMHSFGNPTEKSSAVYKKLEETIEKTLNEIKRL